MSVFSQASSGSVEASQAASAVQQLAAFGEPVRDLRRLLLDHLRQATGAQAVALLRAAEAPPARSEAVGIGTRVLGVAPDPGTGPPAEWLAALCRLLPASPVLQASGGRVVALRDPGSLYGEASKQYAAVVPVFGETGAEAVAAAWVNSGSRADADACRERLELCSGLLALYQTQVDSQEQRRSARLLSVSASVLSEVGQQPKFKGAALALCNEVAVRWKADRVSLGVLRGRYVKLAAMSRTEHLDRKTKLIQAIESAMEECLDQDVEVAWPEPSGTPRVARAAKELVEGQAAGAVISLPLRKFAQGAAPAAVLTVELPAYPNIPAGEPDSNEGPLPRHSLEALRLTCNLVAPLLLKLDDTDRAAPVRAAKSLRWLGAKAVGTEHTWAKLTAIGVLAAILFLVFARGPYRVDAPFLVQATRRQLIIAPYDGYLKEVKVRPGDRVEANQTVLASLETAEQRLQLASKMAERTGDLEEAELARREGKTAKVQIAQAKARRVLADIHLLQYQIDQAQMTSPIDGVVLEGDHTRKIGGSVQRGKTLFEIAPLNDLRMELRVPEDRIEAVEVGQHGELATASNPTSYLPFVVERIEPKAEVLEKQNVFRVWVRFDGPAAKDRPRTIQPVAAGLVHPGLLPGRSGDAGSPASTTPRWLRPGMEGVAKISVGRATYAWLWTHKAVEWVRMKLWL